MAPCWPRAPLGRSLEDCDLSEPFLLLKRNAIVPCAAGDAGLRLPMRRRGRRKEVSLCGLRLGGLSRNSTQMIGELEEEVQMQKREEAPRGILFFIGVRLSLVVGV